MPPASDVPPDQRGQAYQMILNDLIVDKLLSKRSAAEKVTDEEVATTFERFKKNFGSEEELKKQVEAYGQTVAQIKESAKRLAHVGVPLNGLVLNDVKVYI